MQGIRASLNKILPRVGCSTARSLTRGWVAPETSVELPCSRINNDALYSGVVERPWISTIGVEFTAITDMGTAESFLNICSLGLVRTGLLRSTGVARTGNQHNTRALDAHCTSAFQDSIKRSICTQSINQDFNMSHPRPFDIDRHPCYLISDPKRLPERKGYSGLAAGVTTDTEPNEACSLSMANLVDRPTLNLCGNSYNTNERADLP